MKPVRMIALLAIIAFATIGRGSRHSNVSESLHAGFADEPIISWLKPLPQVGRDFTHYLTRPREFTATWMATPSTRLSPWIVLGTSLTIIAVLYAIYARIFRSTPLRRLFPDPPPEERQGITQGEPANPRIVGFGMKTIETGRSVDGQVTSYGESRGFGFAVTFPESLIKGTQAPQIMVFKLGLLHMVVADVIPESVTSKSTQTLFLIIFSVIAAISSFPCAWLLHTTTSFVDAFHFTVITASYWLFFWSLLLLLAVLVVRDLLKIDVIKRFQNTISPRQFAVSCVLTLLWVVIAFLPIVRSVYLSYKELYSVSHWQMVFIIFGSMVLSAIVAPVIFVPFCFVWLKVRSVLEAMT